MKGAGNALVKLVSVLSQVAWIAQSLLFLMSWGRHAFMEDKVSVSQSCSVEGKVCFTILELKDGSDDWQRKWETDQLMLWEFHELGCTGCSLLSEASQLRI